MLGLKKLKLGRIIYLALALGLAFPLISEPMSVKAVSTWQGEYWNETGPLTSPEIPGAEPDLSRTDEVLSFNWDAGSPDPSINTDYFIARWTSDQTFDTGYYTFSASSDDGVRVYLDGDIIINNWTVHGTTVNEAVKNISAGSHHLVVEYFENDGAANVSFSFQKDGIPDSLTTTDITDCEGLQAMENNLTGNYRLANNIDCSSTSTWNAGDGFVPVGSLLGFFQGTLDGNGKVISNLTINTPDTLQPAGLFGVAGATSTIQDLYLANVNISGGQSVGALAGFLSGSAINVHSSGTVVGSGGEVGGLVGAHALETGVGSSSPLVYTWNGSEYAYQSDVGRGIPRNNVGDDDAQLDGDSLAPKDGKYSMKISEEYDEIVYYDELALKTYDTTPGYRVLNSLVRSARDTVYTVSDVPTSPAQSCVDIKGSDCLSQVQLVDNEWTTLDPTTNINTWEVNFGDLSGASRKLLVLKGARDYTMESSQSLRYVQVKDADGNWVYAYRSSQLSSPAGAPRTEVIDMSDKFLTNDYTVKIGMDKTKYNFIGMDTSVQQVYTENIYHPESVSLGFNGYTAVDKTNFWDHDYSTVYPYPPEPFSNPAGNFTKYGDVTPLLQSTDDKFVVMHHGDMMDITFDYQAPVEGTERSFILYNWATFKHSDENDWSRMVNPLPFNGMSSYPYEAPEKYPSDQDHQDYLSEWNTRYYEGTDYSSSHTIIGSSSSATVTATAGVYVGGLVGRNDSKSIILSHATGSVTGTSEVGGLVGRVMNASIESSFATGSVTSVGAARYYAGGLAGSSWGAIVNRSYATGNIGGELNYAGGLIGYAVNGSSLSNVYATGDVSSTGQMDIGGLIGEINNGGSATTLSYAYATGDVSLNASYEGFDVGGLAGASYLGMDHVYATGDVSVSSDTDNQGYAGGLIGRLYMFTEGQVLSNAYATGDVTTSDNFILGSMGGSGGLIGYVGGGEPGTTIDQTYATGSVNDGLYSGGLIGYMYAPNGLEISNSYARGNTSASNAVSSFIGKADLSNAATTLVVNNSYSTGLPTPIGGEVNVGSIFGLVDVGGVGSEITIANVFWDTDTTGISYISDYGVGKSTAEMKNIQTFVDTGFNADLSASVYDFTGTQYDDAGTDDIWTIDGTTNNGYPYFGFSLNFDFSSFINNDGDNVTDATEAAGLNSGDANNDGIPDSQQANVTGFDNTVTGQTSVLEITDGCTILTVDSDTESSQSVTDSGYDYPAGLMNFIAECSEPGQTITVTQYFYGLSNDSFVARKYNSDTGGYQTISGATITQVTIDSQTVTKVSYQITDGGELDQDGLSNGTIVDPSGPGLNTVGTPNTGLRLLNLPKL